MNDRRNLTAHYTKQAVLPMYDRLIADRAPDTSKVLDVIFLMSAFSDMSDEDVCEYCMNLLEAWDWGRRGA